MSELRDWTFIEAHTGPPVRARGDRRDYGCRCWAKRKKSWPLGRWRWFTDACRNGHGPGL